MEGLLFAYGWQGVAVLVHESGRVPLALLRIFTIDHRLHYLHQEGRTVFKFAVTNMSDASALVAERNGLTKDNIAWVIPHQANVRIIEGCSTVWSCRWKSNA